MTSKPIILVVGLLVALGSQISVVSDPKPQSSNNAALGPINQSETINHSTPLPDNQLWAFSESESWREY